MQTVSIQTQDGTCPSYVFHPLGADACPAVLMLMDGPGMRPAVQEMAARLADAGFYVLLPDLFYRAGPYAPIDPRIVFTDKDLRENHRKTLMSSTSPALAMADIGALLAFLEAQPEVKPGPIGVVGYCMGGRLAMIAAGTFPDRIAATASYHGGGLADDKPSSPHLLAPKMKAKIYVAGAIEDANFDDAQKARLELALSNAGVDHLIETYPARHGWVPRDMPVHDAAEAEHHWRTLVPFMKEALQG